MPTPSHDVAGALATTYGSGLSDRARGVLARYIGLLLPSSGGTVDTATSEAIKAAANRLLKKEHENIGPALERRLRHAITRPKLTAAQYQDSLKGLPPWEAFVRAPEPSPETFSARASAPPTRTREHRRTVRARRTTSRASLSGDDSEPEPPPLAEPGRAAAASVRMVAHLRRRHRRRFRNFRRRVVA